MDRLYRATKFVLHKVRTMSKHGQTRCANRRRTNRIRIEEVFRDKKQLFEIHSLQELLNRVWEFSTSYFHGQNL